MNHRLPCGLIIMAIIATVLSGCATAPQQQAFNRDVHANIKTISVLETSPTEVQVHMLNHPGANFGLLGALVAEANQASKEKRLATIMQQSDFEPLAYFKERLDTHLSARGYALVWPSSQTQRSKVPRGRLGLRSAYLPTQNADAQLDINFGFVGYAAAGATDKQPYRPTITMSSRLVSTDGKNNLYTDYFAYNNVFNIEGAVALNASEEYVYPGFDEIEAAGPKAVDGLKFAIDAVAAEVARQL